MLQFHWDNLRVAGVLQRIAVCYGIAALIVSCTPRPRAWSSSLAAILLGYWALLANVAAPGSTAGDYSIEGNLAGWVDRHYLPGKILKSLLRLRRQRGPAVDDPGGGDGAPGRAGRPLAPLGPRAVGEGRRAGRWRASAAGLVGAAWGQRFPIIKNLWTSSFVLVAAGWSLLLLAVFYAVIDVLGFRRWAFFFVVIGVNAITIYVVPRFIDFAKVAQFFLGGVARHSGSFAPVALAAGRSRRPSGCSCFISTGGESSFGSEAVP